MPTHFFLLLTSLTDLALYVKALLEKLIAEECKQCDTSQVLMVLDDVWDNGLLTARLLIQACPIQKTILITSRSENLAIDLGAQTQSLYQFEEEEGIAVLQSYLLDASSDLLKQLVEVLGGHPLALTLAARRAQKASYAGALIDHITEYRRGIPKGEEFTHLKLDQGESREDNLTVVLFYSYAELSMEDQQHFRALGVLAYDEPFDKPMLAALWNVNVTEVEILCDKLRLLSLLELYEGGYGEDWYKQHPILRTYARALLNKASEVDIVHRHYEDHVIKIAEKFDELPFEKWEQLAPYLPHIHAVGNALVEQVNISIASEELLHRVQLFASNICEYLRKNHEIHQNDWLEMGLNASHRLKDRMKEIHFLNTLGDIYRNLNEPSKALDYYQRALSLLQIVRKEKEETRTISNSNLSHENIGANEEVPDSSKLSLMLVPTNESEQEDIQTLNNKEADTLNLIGIAYSDLKETDKALDHYQRALQIYKSMGSQGGEASIAFNTALEYSFSNVREKALDYYQQALLLNQALGDRKWEIHTLYNMGKLYLDAGDHQKALDYYLQLLKLDRTSQTLGERIWEAWTLQDIAKIYLDVGNHKKALDYYLQLLKLDETFGNEESENYTLGEIAKIYLVLEDQEKALNYYLRIIKLAQVLGNRMREADARREMARIYLNIGNPQKALKHYQLVLKLEQTIYNEMGAAFALYNIARIYLSLGDYKMAQDYYQQLLLLDRVLNNKEIHFLRIELEQLLKLS